MGNGLRKAIAEEKWSRVRDMLQEEAVRGRVRNKLYTQEGVKALHLVLKQRAPIDIVRKMLEIDEGRALSTGSRADGELPLHYAVRYYKGWARKEIVKELVDRYPQAIRTPSADGNLPLHVACSGRRPISVLRLLSGHNNNNNNGENNVEQYDMKYVLDENGKTPWEIVKQKSRVWEGFYRMRARKLLKPAINDDDGDNTASSCYVGSENGIEVAATGEIIEGEVFHAAHESLGDEHSKEENCTKEKTKPATAPNKEKNGMCVLCWDGVADHVLIPCGHICLCERCCRRNLAPLKRKCPVCSKAFGQSIKVYHAGVVAAS